MPYLVLTALKFCRTSVAVSALVYLETDAMDPTNCADHDPPILSTGLLLPEVEFATFASNVPSTYMSMVLLS